MIFIPSNETNSEWAEKYTRSSYKRKEKIDNKLYNFYLKEFKEHGYITLYYYDKEVLLSHEDSVKFLKCFTCDKIFCNNARQYCLSCEYYFPYL